MLAFIRNYFPVSVNLLHFKYFQFLQKILQNYEERRYIIYYLKFFFRLMFINAITLGADSYINFN